MTKKTKEETEVAGENNLDPLAAPEAGRDLPAAWERPENGDNLPALPGESAALEHSDFITPKLALIAKNGDKEGRFTPGSWVLDKEIQFTKEAGEPIQMVVLKPPVKFYQEHVDYDPDVQTLRKRFRTLQEVQDAGLTVDWDNVNNVPPTAERAALVTVLILKPEAYSGETGFGMQLEGLGNCAVASWLLANASSYKYAARRIFTTIALDLKDRPIYSQLWTVRSELVKMGRYPVVAPIMMPTKTLPPETQEVLKATFNLK